MKAEKINAIIATLVGPGLLWAEDGEDGCLYLRDGMNEADITGESEETIRKTIYDWAVFVGYTIERYEDFVA